MIFRLSIAVNCQIYAQTNAGDFILLCNYRRVASRSKRRFAFVNKRAKLLLNIHLFNSYSLQILVHALMTDNMELTRRSMKESVKVCSPPSPPPPPLPASSRPLISLVFRFGEYG